MMKKLNPINADLFWRKLNAQLAIMYDVYDEISRTRDFRDLRDRFYYSIYLKLQYILDGISLQIYNLDHKPHYSLVIALALRTAMLDVLNLYYVVDVHENVETAEERINAIMADHIRYVYKSLTIEGKKEVIKNWPELFDKDMALRKFARIGTTEFYKGIINFSTLKIEADEAKYIYQLFSKYEHNGALTFDMLHNPYTKGGLDMIKDMVYRAICVCSIASKHCSSNWISDDSALAVRFNESIKDLQEFSLPKKEP